MFFLICALAANLHAQLGVKLDLDREHYILYEPIQATIQLRNYAGNTLVFGTEDAAEEVGGYLKFEVIRAGGLSAPDVRKNVNPVENLILGPGETKELTVQLNGIVNMAREGNYTVSVRVGHPRLSHDYKSDSVPIDITEGYPVWTRTAGVPQDSETNSIPPRKVSLLRFRSKEGETYVLRVEDDRMVYGIVRLGPYLSSSRPEYQIDAMSNIHLLYQIHPRLYVYRIYDIDVELKQNLYYAMEETVPTLRRDPDVGSIRLVGGRRAKPGEDYQLKPGTGPESVPQALSPNSDSDSEDGTLQDPRKAMPRLPRKTIPATPESSSIPDS
ncbi:MAG: hypothetical protein ACOCUY_00195 [Verrucomicrobiota bacterium]